MMLSMPFFKTVPASPTLTLAVHSIDLTSEAAVTQTADFSSVRLSGFHFSFFFFVVEVWLIYRFVFQVYSTVMQLYIHIYICSFPDSFLL